MSFYFHVSTGLRGCYMPDNSAVIRCDTRRELKAALKYECDGMRECYAAGGSKREIASVTAEAWRMRRKDTLDHCIPFARDRGGEYAFGVFVSSASRNEYLEYFSECE